MSAKLQLYGVFDIGVARIDRIEEEQFRLVNNQYQMVLTLADFCNRVAEAQPNLQNLVPDIMPFEALIPHIALRRPVSKPNMKIHPITYTQH